MENVTLNVTSPVQAVMRGVTRPVAYWVNNITDAGALSVENKKLRDENERLTNELTRSREDAIQQQNANDLNTVGFAAMSRGDYGLAETFFTRAMQLNPQFDRTAWDNLVYLKQLAHKPPEAGSPAR